MKRYLLIFASFFLWFPSFSETTAELVDSYLSKYSSIAVSEMYRSGIPASITLAQGLLESGWGMGTLAKEANNHFGIKCHSDWTGETISHNDDSKGECFRKYPEVSDSYRDHSDFLRFRPRYASLFEFEITDYKSWAYGLKKAGYATDPAYADKLINVIEKYDLARFDKTLMNAAADSTAQSVSDSVPESDRPTVASSQSVSIPETPLSLTTPERYKGLGRKGTYAVSLHREILKLNGVPFIYARRMETYRSIADLYDLFPKELAAYNDSKDIDRPLESGEMVFLEYKARQAVKGMDKYICSEGDMLHDIAQKFAVKEKCLKKRNKIEDSSVPMREDDTILLRDVKKKKNTEKK